ncbi:disease resistance protein TAO1-like [Gossypium australe]|uniref:Disease resistance protein TAO1-like n=1 Tax=Gossypium australe TaxID=47621 RepID=A0A5B6WJS0_9ROSI|nr:disease resistance protein TAO1-like [Gossypium australe]
MASSSSSSSTLMKYHVFLSFRGKDTRLSFTTHLLQALKDKGLDVFFDEDKLERGEQLSQELSRAIAVSNMSIILLSEDYASSNSCLAELSDIMDRYRSKQQIVLPIFYQVNPSDVENHDGSFKTSFDQHEATRSVDEVKRWKTAFAEVGKLEGWPIDGSISDRPETQYIKDVVEDVIKKLSNLKSGSASEELVGIDDQKRTILELIKKEDCRVIGLWGMGGQGKTTLADAVYKEISSEFDSSWFLENVREEIEKQGKKSLRNELLSKLLNSNVDIDTPSIGKIFQERLNNRKVLVVLDDISDPNQIDYMGVKHLGSGSKIIITSREKQVLKSGGADTIHEVKALNKDDSLQLFSTFAFKQLNPEVDFRDLSWKFVEYSQGSPLALKVLGCNLYGRTINAWESEMEKLGEYSRPEIFEVLKSSYDRLDKVEKNIFLDIACFFKGEPKKLIKHVLSCYQGVEDGISKLVSKCLINISSSYNGDIISMHDMLEEFGKDIIRQKSKTPRKCRRLWSHEHITRVLKYNQGTDRIQGMKLNTSHMDKQLLSPFVFENMTNLKYIIFYSSLMLLYGNCKKLYTNQVDIVSLPDELKYLRWDGYPCKSLPSNFNPKNLVVLKLLHGDMEQLWDGHPNLPNLREIDGFVNLREIRFFMCVNLRKIPNFSKAINLKILNCSGCESLVELWNEDDDMGLVNLREIRFNGCVNLRKIPNFSRAINLEILNCSYCKSLVELWNEDDDMGLVNLREIRFNGCVKLRKILNFSRAINLEILNCSYCKSLVELWNEDDDMGLVKLREIRFNWCANLRKIPNFSRAINLEILDCSGCESLVELWNEDDDMGLVKLREICFHRCVNLRKIPNFSRAINLEILDCSWCESLVELWNEDVDMGLVKLRVIRFHRCVNLRKIPNFSRAINLEILDCSWCESLVELWNEDDDMGLVKLRVICFRRCVNLRKIPNFSRAINLEILDCSWCESLVELWNEDDDMGLVKLRHQVFLSFRGEDTRLNFTSHLLKALKDTGMNVFFDEDILEKWDQLSLALSQAIAVANLSIIILSVNYASSKSCLAELSDIMRRKDTQGHIVLPIFYHVDPSDVRNLGGRFKTSFDDHELKNIDQVQQWQAAFAEVGKLKGWHIEGCKFDRPETEYIKDIVDYVIKKLMNSKFESVPEELVGIDDQKKMILRLIDQEDNRIIGLWGMGGIGKTTLADVVYKEASPRFEDHHFLQNVCEKLQKQGMESLRNDFLSKLLNQNICIDTPSIGSTLIQRLNNKRVIVVIDDVNDPDQIDCMVKSLLTSRDRQVLKNGGVDKLHEVKKLNENDSLRLFSTFAFKLLNPSANFRDLSNKFVKYAQGSPLALKVLGSKLYTKPKKDWESEVDKLKEYAQPKITQILKRSFDGLDELEKNIFLDIACFMKWTPKKDVEELLSCYYKGAVCGISNLIDKCLLEITPSQSIYLHDMLEEMGKDIVRQESKSIGMRSRLWDPEDVDKVLRYRKGTQSIEGIVLDMSQIKVELRLHPSTFENMINLKYLHFYSRNSDKKLLVKEHDTDLVNLSCFVLNGCKNLRKIPKLLGAINLVHIECIGCESLVELPCLNHLASLDSLNLDNCCSLKEFPELPNSISALHLTETAIEEVPDSIGHLEMDLHSCFWLESLHLLDLSSCPIAKFPEIPRNLKELCLPRTEIEEVPSCFDCQSSLTLLDLSGTSIKTVDGPSLIKRFENLERLKMNGCESLEFLSNVPLNLGCLEAHGCTSLEKVTFTYQNLFEVPDDVSMIFSNCFHLNQDSIDSIEKTAMIKVRAQIAPNRRIGDRFLAFAICLVADLTNCLHYQDLEFICEYQLKATDGGNEKFKTKWYDNEVRKFESELEDFEFMGDQVLILFHDDMVKKDKDYEEASFEFYIKGRNYRWKEDKDKIDGIEVKKCGVHVFYVDESLSNIVSDEDQSDEMSNNVSDEDKIDETSSDASDEDQLDETSSDASDEDQEMCNFEEMSKDVCSVGEDIPDPIPQRKRRKTKNTYDHEGNEDGSDW